MSFIPFSYAFLLFHLRFPSLQFCAILLSFTPFPSFIYTGFISFTHFPLRLYFPSLFVPPSVTCLTHTNTFLASHTSFLLTYYDLLQIQSNIKYSLFSTNSSHIQQKNIVSHIYNGAQQNSYLFTNTWLYNIIIYDLHMLFMYIYMTYTCYFWTYIWLTRYYVIFVHIYDLHMLFLYTYMT